MGAFSTGNTMDLHKIVSEMINSVKLIDNNTIYSMGLETYMREFRTYMLAVPRRAGKTTTISSLSRNLSALAYYNKYPLPNTACRRRIENEDPTSFCGRNFNGLKYECILLDEYKEVPDKVYQLISYLNAYSLMSSNFFILGLYTP